MATLSVSSPALPLASHLIALPDSQWAFWKCVCLRGAGFPAQGVLKLGAAPEVIESADAVRDAEKTANAAQQRALQQVNASLDTLRLQNQWDDKSRRVPLLRARDSLKSGNVPAESNEVNGWSAIRDYRDALDKVAPARDAFREKFAACSLHISQVIRDTAASSRFREAVIWQNRKAVHTAFDPLLRKSSDGLRTSNQRQIEELVASYMQRYSVKNDTIGFFGPVGWAEFVSEGKSMVVVPGRDLLAARTVYFESWPINELAAIAAKDRRIYPWLPPIQMPFIRLENSLMQHPIYGAIQISPQHAAILHECDGISTAKAIAERLLRSRAGLFKRDLEIYAELAEMSSKNMIFWGLEVPLCPYPEQAYREILRHIEDPALRKSVLAPLEKLEAARNNVAAAVGDVTKLDLALERLEQTFVEVTGLPATRAHGQTYAGRTIIYEDCRRDIQVRLGPELLNSLAQPLILLLTAARWLTWRIVKGHKTKFMDRYTELCRAKGTTVVSASEFWLSIMPYIFGDFREEELGPVQKEFQEKWARILQLSPGRKAVAFSTEELRERVMTEFAAPGAGWGRARYHSPDIMIAASSPEAIARGEYEFVLGEMHVASNTFAASLFVNQHPSPEELLRNVEQDLGGSNLVPMPAKKEMQLISRTAATLIAPSDMFLEYARDGLAFDRSKAVPISSLSIEKHDDELFAVTADGQKFKLIELMGWRLAELVTDSFKMFIPSSYNPRISIDRMVVKRESWRFKPADIPFAREQDPAERFLLSRKWMEEHELPRFLFYKVPVETKPAYMDLHSPIFIDIFSRMVRRTAEANLPHAVIEVTEMFPTVDQTWLPDGENNRYSCELRIVALDVAS